MHAGPSSKGRTAGGSPEADAGSSPAGSNKSRQWRCEHEHYGYLDGQLRLLRWWPPLFVMLGSLGTLMHAHWVLLTVIHTLTALSIALCFKLNREAERVAKREIAQWKALAESANRSFVYHVENAPDAVLEGMAANGALPAELRAELQRELSRRGKGILN